MGHIICVLIALAGLASVPAHSRQRFTVTDDIAFSYFGDPFNAGASQPVIFSPDSRYFIVRTQRGRLDLARPETTLRIYRTTDVRAFLTHPQIGRELVPFWSFSRSSYKDGPIITEVRWLTDSSAVAFLAKAKSGNDQLTLADLKTRTIHPLTPENQDVTGFDIHDRNHFVYTVLSPALQKRADSEAHAASIPGTGRNLYSLVFPSDIHSEMEAFDRSELWAVAGDQRFRVEDKSSRRSLTVYSAGQQILALSPDGRSVVTALALSSIPQGWDSLYPAARPFLRNRLRAGKQDTEAFSGFSYISEYVLVDLFTGNVKKLTNAPIADIIGWAGTSQAVWSADSKFIALLNTFLDSNRRSADQPPKRPCIVLFDVEMTSSTCLEHLNGQATDNFDQGPAEVTGARFSRDSQQVILDYRLPTGSSVIATHRRGSDGTWRIDSKQNQDGVQDSRINVFVKQGLNDPPVLVAVDPPTKRSLIIWDPNPQLRNIDLGEASIYRWKDKGGHDFIGGLYKPPDYVQTQRYPLVIQTHGFRENEFIPSGLYPSAFAARELAAEGIMVLQVRDIPSCAPHLVTPEEGPCVVAGYEKAVEQLARDGLIDPNRVGIVGFSRTSYYVMEALTTSKLHFAAASISDGVDAGYFQYLIKIDLDRDLNANEDEGMIGARPFAEGLQEWLRRSPEFNLDKVNTPLQVVALNRASVLLMWESYAGLRILNKPVDLIILPEGTHVLSNPAGRLASQGGTVDWFRFWLQGYEDPDPAKVKQYARWRELRKLQEENDAKKSANGQLKRLWGRQK